MKNKIKKLLNFPTDTVVRSEQEINQQYTSLCAQLGQAEYNAFILGKRIEWLREQLVTVDKEMAKRQDLNKAAQPTNPSTAPQVSNVQS